MILRTLFLILILIGLAGFRFDHGPEVPPDSLDLSIHRFREGLELQRLLYEKLLELDHHFGESKPAHSGETSRVEGMLEQGASGEVEEQWRRLLSGHSSGQECFYLWLDLRSDQRALYREARELHIRNDLLMEDAARLFRNYTRILGYEDELMDCRAQDDWNELHHLLRSYEQRIRQFRTAGKEREADLAHVDLEFAVDRLLEFIAEYRRVVRRGTVHYRQYLAMLDELGSAAETCLTYVTEKPNIIREQVRSSRDKYQSAYDLAELEGSRLKRLLYGFD